MHRAAFLLPAGGHKRASTICANAFACFQVRYDASSHDCQSTKKQHVGIFSKKKSLYYVFGDCAGTPPPLRSVDHGAAGRWSP
jgi:hypothetical protein